MRTDGVGEVKAGQQAQQRGFARAGGAEDDGPIGGEAALDLQMEAAAAGIEESSSTAASTRASAQVDGGQGSGAKGEQDGRGAVGGGVVEVLHLVVKHDGEGAGCAGNVSAEHEHHAELAHGVEEAEHRCGNETGEQAAPVVCGPGAQGQRQAGELRLRARLNRGEARCQRLHGEGEAVDDRADDKPGKRKRERMAEQGSDAATKAVRGPKRTNRKNPRTVGGRTKGSVVVKMTPEDHDRAMAVMSHLPHIAAAALVLTLPEEYFRLAGPGLFDTTRVAGGDPALWQQILKLNRDNVLLALEHYGAKLAALHAALRDDNQDEITRFLTLAKKGRDALGS